MGFEFDKSGHSYYVPSAFYINVSNDVFDAEGKPRVEGWPTLMHEYTHLIQDRATLYGAVDFLLFYDWARAILGVLAEFDKDIRLPLCAAKETKRMVHELFALRRFMHMRDEWRNGTWWAFESFSLVDHTLTFEGEARTLKIAMANFVDNVNDEQYSHPIGQREIKEAYAVAVGLIFGNPLIQSAHQFEYLAVERILSQFGAVNPQQCIAICHWSLQDTNPCVRFFEICELLRDRGFSELPDVETLYDILRDAAKEQGFEEKIATLERQLDEIQKIQAEAGDGNLLSRILAWYQRHVLTALRRSIDPGRRFPVDTCLGGPFVVGFAESFEKLTAEEPLPIVAQPGGEVIGYGGDDLDDIDTNAGFFFRAMIDLLNRLWTSSAPHWQCPLYSACDLKFKDSECLERPWMKGELSPTCSYGLAANYLGIPDNRAPVAKITQGPKSPA